MILGLLVLLALIIELLFIPRLDLTDNKKYNRSGGLEAQN